MIRINLLPFRLARKKENIRRQVSIFVLLLVFSTFCLYYGNYYWNDKIHAVTLEVDHLDHELKVAMKAAREVDRIKKDLDDLKQKKKVIDGLKAHRRKPVEMLDAMTGLVIEKRMWFTSFSEHGGTVTIKGIALDNTTVADFMKRLEKSGLFSTVNLGNLKQEKFDNRYSLKGFDITCQKASPKSTVKTEAKVS